MLDFYTFANFPFWVPLPLKADRKDTPILNHWYYAALGNAWESNLEQLIKLFHGVNQTYFIKVWLWQKKFNSWLFWIGTE